MAEFNVERMCRLNGKKPNARDKWVAFHRLWRLSHRKGDSCWLDGNATDCFRVLWADWRPRMLLDDDREDPLITRRSMPLFLRKRFLELDRKRRLYGECMAEWGRWQERDRRVAAKVRNEQGIEVTPAEVAETRRKVINLARRKAAERGLDLPEDDEELLDLLRERD